MVTDNYSYPGNYNPNTGRTTGGSVYNNPPVSTPIQYNEYSTNIDTYSNTGSVTEKDRKSTASTSSQTGTNLSKLYAEVEPNAALRVAPNYMANSKYAIPKGTIVKVIKYNEYYYQAEVIGHIGYLLMRELTCKEANLLFVEEGLY
ncbi:hypothetical protein [Spirosoma fluminis]